MIEDELEVTHLLGKKLDKPITIKWESEIKKNKMEQVAKLFIKELGEEFNVKIKCWNGRSGEIKAKFTPLGLKVKTVYNAWELRNDYLADLLIGKAVIVDEGRR